MLSVEPLKIVLFKEVIFAFKKQIVGQSVKDTDVYLFDNQMQLLTAIDDFEYTKWLDPEGVPCYVKDSVCR